MKKNFISKKKQMEKDHGVKKSLVLIPKILTKKLTIKKVQLVDYNIIEKNECGYLLKGKLLINTTMDQKN